MRLPRVGLGSRVCLFLASTAVTAPGVGWAQPAPAPVPPVANPTGVTAPELNPAARVPRPVPRDQDIFAPEPAGPCPLESSTVQVTLSSVTFRGATAVSAADFAGAYAEYVGKPSPVSVVCLIRDRAARILFDRGVLARVEIPEQRISGGALVLEVIEAHVVNVRVRGDIGPAQAAVERYVEKLRGMKPFDMRKAQRYLLLASDVPGVRVRAAVKPSITGERGAVDIDVSVSRDGVNAVANVQNFGSKAAGPWAGLARADFQSFTSYGENTSVVAYHTLDSNEQWVLQLSEAVRLGSDGWIGRGSAVYGESRPGGAASALDLKSKSVVGNLEAVYPLIRMRRQNLNLGGGLDFVNQDTDIGGALLSRDRLRVAYLRADGDLRTRMLEHLVQLDGAITVRKGFSGLGASKASDGLITRGFAKPDAWLVRGVGSAETLLADRLSGSVRVQAQYSRDALLPYEQISLGALSIGRGYAPAAVLGDSGAGAAFEVHYGPIQLHPKLLAAPFGFFDVGYVHNNHTATSGLPPGRTLRSVGAGVTLRLANRANLEITYAHPLDAVFAGAKRPSDRLLISLTASIL
ncbi:MAG: ShlB/FhaC/HecB family hemolysin secretion/activation protein [Phenylobacterium sp.]|nr:ShlB/FhaC/HecB family hemolysin secretion/activation protein [Phenylobacterium sp.]